VRSSALSTPTFFADKKSHVNSAGPALARPPRFAALAEPRLPHLLVAHNSEGEAPSIPVLVKTQGSATKLVGQMQPFGEARSLGRQALGGVCGPALLPPDRRRRRFGFRYFVEPGARESNHRTLPSSLRRDRDTNVRGSSRSCSRRASRGFAQVVSGFTICSPGSGAVHALPGPRLQPAWGASEAEAGRLDPTPPNAAGSRCQKAATHVSPAVVRRGAQASAVRAGFSLGEVSNKYAAKPASAALAP